MCIIAITENSILSHIAIQHDGTLWQRFKKMCFFLIILILFEFKTKTNSFLYDCLIHSPKFFRSVKHYKSYGCFRVTNIARRRTTFWDKNSLSCQPALYLQTIIYIYFVLLLLFCRLNGIHVGHISFIA